MDGEERSERFFCNEMMLRNERDESGMMMLIKM